MFLEKCKYIAKEREMPEYITDEVEISSGSDRKILMNQIPMKLIQMNKIRYRT